jgi:putative acetyltransferase
MSEEKAFTIRKATHDDLDRITELFRETILHINSKDYSEKQVNTWASRADKLPKWHDRIRHQYFILAEREGTLLGFGSITSEAYLDTIFVHKDHQKEGIGSAILEKLLANAKENGKTEVFTEASLTARPFLEKHSFRTNRPQQKVRDGVVFVNFAMIRAL